MNSEVWHGVTSRTRVIESFSIPSPENRLPGQRNDTGRGRWGSTPYNACEPVACPLVMILLSFTASIRYRKTTLGRGSFRNPAELDRGYCLVPSTKLGRTECASCPLMAVFRCPLVDGERQQQLEVKKPLEACTRARSIQGHLLRKLREDCGKENVGVEEGFR